MPAKSKKDLKASLDKLGKSADAIARSLEKLGIRGKLSEPCQCPLARYLRIEGFREVDVAGYSITVKNGGLRPSRPIATFIGRFDSYMYPRLIRG